MATGGLTIGEVARRTGLTERTLRFYEQEGLVSPGRNAAGQRAYGAGDLEAVARTRLLKKAGFDLRQIKALVGREIDARRLVAEQIEALKSEAKRVADALAVIEPIRARLDAGGVVDVDMLCAMIEAAECAAQKGAWAAAYDRYFTAEEQDEWRALSADAFANMDAAALNAAWTALARKIRAAAPLDPSTPRAQALLDEFDRLLAPFAKVASPEQMRRTSEFWRRVGEWGADVDMPWTQECSDFIRAAKEARASDGEGR